MEKAKVGFLPLYLKLYDDRAAQLAYFAVMMKAQIHIKLNLILMLLLFIAIFYKS